MDALSESLMEATEAKRIFIVDGTTLLTAHSSENIEKYERYKNQHGASHYPLLRACVATDARTGIVVRPSHSPYQGEGAIGEIGLAEELLERLPQGSIVIGDRLYGCPRFAAHAAAASHQVIIRVKEVNAKRYIGVPDSPSGEMDVVWESNRMHRGKSTLLANRHQFNLLSLGPLGESRAGTREAGRRAERGISLPVAGAPTLPSESDVENDMTFGGRVSCDETVVAISEKCQKKSEFCR